jgi:hypothetical protein
MPFKAGKTGNPKGRPKGKGNKVTRELRVLLATFMDQEFDGITETFKALPARDRVKVFVDLLPYAIPRLGNVEFKSDIDKLSPEDIDILAEAIIKKIQ